MTTRSYHSHELFWWSRRGRDLEVDDSIIVGRAPLCMSLRVFASPEFKPSTKNVTRKILLCKSYLLLLSNTLHAHQPCLFWTTLKLACLPRLQNTAVWRPDVKIHATFIAKLPNIGDIRQVVAKSQAPQAKSRGRPLVARLESWDSVDRARRLVAFVDIFLEKVKRAVSTIVESMLFLITGQSVKVEEARMWREPGWWRGGLTTVCLER